MVRNHPCLFFDCAFANNRLLLANLKFRAYFSENKQNCSRYHGSLFIKVFCNIKGQLFVFS